jgi:hypothetical protein
MAARSVLPMAVGMADKRVVWTAERMAVMTARHWVGVKVAKTVE